MKRVYQVLLPLVGRIDEMFTLCECSTAAGAAAVVEAVLANDNTNKVGEITIRVIPDPES